MLERSDISCHISSFERDVARRAPHVSLSLVPTPASQNIGNSEKSGYQTQKRSSIGELGILLTKSVNQQKLHTTKKMKNGISTLLLVAVGARLLGTSAADNAVSSVDSTASASESASRALQYYNKGRYYKGGYSKGKGAIFSKGKGGYYSKGKGKGKGKGYGTF
eukprot:scaffold178_cov163-Amphora_coffeaeformis.AAC.7